MTTVRIVLISENHLVAAGLDPKEFLGRVSAWEQVTEARLVRGWTPGEIGPVPDGAVVVLAGRSAPLPWLEDRGCRQFPVDLAVRAAWLAGPAAEKTAVLIRAALAAAEKVPAFSRLTIQTFPRLLVAGVGRAAETTVRAADQAGLEVVWLGPENNGHGPGNVELRPGRRLAGAAGFAGRFQVLLTSDHGFEEIQVGAILVCGHEARTPLTPPGDLKALPLSVFEGELRGNPRPDWADKPDFQVAFIAGAGRSTSTDNMRRVLEAALAVAAGTKARACVFAAQVKVAESGLERLYTQARQAGVVFIRTPESGPVVESSGDGAFRLRVYDPLAGAELVLAPDLVVVEETLSPAIENGDLAAALGLTMGKDGYLSPDNILFLPASTNRRGIFALGPARGTEEPGAVAWEAAQAVAEARRIIGATEIEASPLEVDLGRCTLCLTCVRTCPHQALGFAHRPSADPVACRRCGLCAAECPMDALQLAPFTDPLVKARLEVLLGRPREKTAPPRLVVFGCRRSAAAALAAAPPPQAPVDLCFITLPCAGRIEDDLVWSAFLLGADGVLVAACHEDNCRTHRGSPEARRRLEHLRRLLEETGFPPERLGFTTTAPNLGVGFSRAIVEFNRRIGEMGPGPAAECEK
ncbi:MAG: hydrogenase iron-sulfur subunit [Thermodesulfobacteriota bacterium]